MKERQIIFNSDMVNAILGGKKTQTRRVIKRKLPHGAVRWALYNDGWLPQSNSGKMFLNEEWNKPLRCPYGKPGDHLWVRETWQAISPHEDPVPLEESNIFYRADGPHPGIFDEDDPTEPYQGWRPSIHMPRWVSRITLKIVCVRVERLKDIDYDDILAEGIEPSIDFMYGDKVGDADWDRDKFIELWNSINEKRGYGWDSNPWVWVIEFKQVENDSDRL